MPRRAPDPKRGKKPSPSPASLRRRGKPKFCVFCREKIEWVDYKDVNLLRRFLSDRAKIKARRVTGTCREHQGLLAAAIKTSRELALLPYVQRTTADRLAGRGGRRGRDGDGGGRRREAEVTPAEGSGEAAAPDGAGTEAGAVAEAGSVQAGSGDERVEVSVGASAGEAGESGAFEGSGA